MAQIVPRDTIGQRFGSGLSAGLEQLAQLRLQQLANRQSQAQSMGRLQGLGLAPEEAAFVATLPPQQQFEVVQALFRAGGGAQPQEESQGLDMLAALQPQQQQSGLQQLVPAQPIPQAPAQNGAPKAQQPAVAAPVEAQAPAAPSPLPPQIAGLLPAVKEEKKEASGVEKALTKPVSSKEVAKELVSAQNARRPGLREALAAPTRKEEIELQKRIDKETEDFYKETLGQAEAAKKADQRLNRMEKLVKKGRLPISGLYNALKGLEELSPSHAGPAGLAAGGYFGGPIGAAIGGTVGALISPVASVLRSIQRRTSPDTEEFEKLSADFIKDAKSFFGGRITDADLRAFMQTIPTLSQSDEGKLKIINNIRSFNEAAQVKAEAMKDIIRENKGRRPANIQILVEERAKKKLDELADEFEAR